nr:MAG TPA: hypothetical protein [Caudoviricetes sp.]DAX14675.1 MAG TPA: hypothetical protein [Bacteriophage sp.]
MAIIPNTIPIKLKTKLQLLNNSFNIGDSFQT